MTGLVIADRVKETTATTGTGTLTLAGAATGFQSFAVVGNGNQCNICIISGNGTGWEIQGASTYTLSGTTLTRTAANVLDGSSGPGVLVSLTGTSTVFLTEPASALRHPPRVAPPLAANWTQRNFAGTTSLVDSPIGPFLKETASQNSIILRGMTIASPSTPYTIDATLSVYGPSDGNNTFGMGWTDGTKYQAMEVFVTNSAPIVNKLVVEHYSNATTFTATDCGPVFFQYSPSEVYFRVSDDGTNVTFSNSVDGVSFIQLFTVAKSSGYLGTSGYTNVGIFIDFNTGAIGTQTAAIAATLKSWYQH